jgi:hypothetical protein
MCSRSLKPGAMLRHLRRSGSSARFVHVSLTSGNHLERSYHLETDHRTQPVTVPKDVHDLTTLVRSIAICGEKGTLVVDPTQYEL